MPRFEVTVALETAQADRDRESFFSRLKSDLKGLESLPQGGALGGMRRELKESTKDADEYRTRLTSIRADIANMSRRPVNPLSFQDAQKDLEKLYGDLNNARQAAKALGTDSEVKAYSLLITQTVGQLDKLAVAQKRAFGRVAEDNPLMGGQSAKQVQGFVGAVKELDAYMTQMEANRRAGKSTLAAYRQELLQIQQASLGRANDASLSDAERSLYLDRSKKAGGLVNAADTREAEKLTLAITRLKAQLAEEAITAERAGLAFDRLAQRARNLAEAQGASESAARRFLQIQQQAQKLGASGAGGDASLATARAQGAALTELTSRWRANLIVTKQGEKATESYRNELTQIARAARQEAASTQHSTEARRQYVKVAEQAIAALRKLKGEELNASTGGNLPFVLQNLAFGFGAPGALGGQFINDALELSEKAKAASLNIAANAKFYKLNVGELNKSIQDTAKEIRLNATDVAEATSYLIKAGFNPEMAATAIKRFSDSASANALDAVKAIKGGAQGIQQGLSRTLNEAGVEENIGPEIQAIDRAIKKGEEWFRTIYLYNQEARKQFDINRKNGQSFTEAAQAAGRWQFLMKSTAVDAGRTAETVHTLTAALNNYKAQRDKAKVGLIEGVSQVATPVLNVASGGLDFFNRLPEWQKSIVGIVAAVGTLTLIVGSATMGLLALSLQTRRVIAEDAVLAALQARLTANTGLYARTLTLLNTELFRTTVLTRSASAAQIAAVGSTGALATATTGLNRALALVGLTNPYTAILAAVGVAAVATVAFTKSIEKTYDEIEKREKEFWDNLKTTRGEEYAEKFSRLLILREARGQLLQRQAANPTPQTAASIQRIDTEIAKTEENLRALNKLGAAKKGSAGATREQAEAFQSLRTQMDAISERYGDMKLTDFQKEIRAAQKEQERLNREIEKGVQLYSSSEGKEGLNPEQAANLRQQAEQLVPGAMTGLAQREAEEARKSALAARSEMEKALNEYARDGVEKRRNLLKIETRDINAEYTARIRQVRANLKDPNIQVSGALSGEENKRRALAMREVATAEQSLIRERNSRIKVLERQAAQDLLAIQRERDQKMLDAQKAAAQGRITVLRAQLEGANANRDSALEGQDIQGRLNVERAYYASTLRMAQDAARAEAGIRRGEAEIAYRLAVADAQSLGEDRVEAERLARERYQGELKANELQLQNELTRVKIDADKRVHAAQTALLKESVDRELRGIDQIEGKRLQALLDRYQRELRLARQRGEGERADTLGEAVKTIQDEARGRVEETGRIIRETTTQIGDFSGQLDSLVGKAKKGVEGAREQAAQPFDTYLNALRDERVKLEKARDKLMPNQTAQRDELNRQIAQLGKLSTAGTAARTQAIARATADFQQKENDKIMEERARLAEKLYDGGEGDAAAYQAALRSEASYWQARLRGMEQGSDDYERTRTRLEEIRQKQRDAKLLAAQKPLERARNALALNQGDSEAARSEEERNRLLEERARLLGEVLKLEEARARNPELKPSERATAKKNAQDTRSQLNQTNAQIAGLPTEDARFRLEQLAAQRELVKGDAARAALDTERLRLARQIAAQEAARAKNAALPLGERRQAEQASVSAQKEVLDLERALREQREANAKSLQDLAAAQVDYALTLGRSDTEITAAMQGQLALTRDQIEAQDRLIQTAIARGESETYVNGLRTQRVQLQGQELAQERALGQRPLDLAMRRLSIEERITQARLILAGLDENEVEVADAAVRAAQAKLDLAQQQRDLAMRQGTQEQQDTANADVIAAQAELVKAQSQAANAPLRAEERRLALARTLGQVRLAEQGLLEDEAASAQESVRHAEEEYRLAQQAVGLARTEEAQVAAREAAGQKYLTLLKAQEELRLAPLKAEERRIALARTMAQIRLAENRLLDDEVAAAQEGLTGAQEEYALAVRAAELAQGAVAQERAREAAGQKYLALLRAQDAAAGAVLQKLERELKVYGQLAQARLILAGVGDDEAAQAQLAVDLAERQVTLAQQALAASTTPVQTDQARANLLTAQAELLKAQQGNDLAPVRAQERRLSLVQAETELRAEMDGLGRNEVARAERALNLARQERGIAESAVLATAKSGTQVQKDAARAALLSKQTAELQAQRALVDAQLAQQDRALDRLKSTLQAQAELSGALLSSTGQAELGLTLTRTDLAETERRINNAKELNLDAEQLQDLQTKRLTLLAQEVRGQYELNRAVFERVKLEADLADAAIRSQLARSRFFNDAVALARVDLISARMKLSLNAQEMEQADSLGRTENERLTLQRERQQLLGEEAEAVRNVAKAERERVVFVRALRESLEGLKSVSQDQGDANALNRARRDAELSARRLTEAQEDAQDALRQIEKPDGLAFEEAREGKERIEALTAAISDYRAKLEGVADAYNKQISGIESLVQATLRLNEVATGGGYSDFGAQVNVLQNEQALRETDRVLGNQRASYDQITAAAGRLAQAEGERLNIGKNLLNTLAEQAKAGDSGAREELRQRLTSLGMDGQKVADLLRKVGKEGASALSGVTLQMTREAQDRLARLQELALSELRDVDRLRAEEFKTRLESEKVMEEYAALNTAARLTDRGFSELEAAQLEAIDRQGRLNDLMGKTSFLDPAAISKKDAAAAAKQENQALVEQVMIRKQISDAKAVTRDDVELQKEINAEVVKQAELQRAAAEAALLPYNAKVELTKETAEALKREEDQLARMAAKRLNISPSQVTRAQVAEQRRLNELLTNEMARAARIVGERGSYNANAPEVRAAIALDYAMEDARYSNKNRMERALKFEQEKAKAVASIYAEAISKAVASALSGAIGGAVEGAVKGGELKQGAAESGREMGKAFTAQTRNIVAPQAKPQPPAVITPPVLARASQNAQATVQAAAPASTIHNKNVTYNLGGINVNVTTTQPQADPAGLADAVFSELQRRADLTGDGC